MPNVSDAEICEKGTFYKALAFSQGRNLASTGSFCSTLLDKKPWARSRVGDQFWGTWFCGHDVYLIWVHVLPMSSKSHLCDRLSSSRIEPSIVDSHMYRGRFCTRNVHRPVPRRARIQRRKDSVVSALRNEERARLLRTTQFPHTVRAAAYLASQDGRRDEGSDGPRQPS